MRRRSFLATLSGVGVGTSGLWAGSGTVGAHTPPAGTPPEGTQVATAAGPHGRVPFPDAAEAVVGDDGTTVYVATQDGFAVVDTSDPHDLSVLATVDDILDSHDAGPMQNVQDVKVDGDTLLVVGPAHPRPQVVAAAVVYDVRDPPSPEQVGVHETDYPIHNAFLDDDVAFLTGNGVEGNPLVTVSVDDEPEELGRWTILDEDPAWADVASSLRVVHDVWVQDDVAYLAHWDAGTWIVDVADPAEPSTVSRVRGRDPNELADIEGDAVATEGTELPGNDHYVTVDEDATVLGVGAEVWDTDGDGEGAPGGIEFYDLRDVTEPTRLGSIEPPPTSDPARDGVWTTSHNFELVAGHCYSSWYQGGVRVHDLSDPMNPEEIYAWRDERVASFWTAQRAAPGETFVASSVGIGNSIGPDAPEDGDGTAGATATDDSLSEPALYVFPDPVQSATSTPTDTRVPPTATAGDADSVAGPGFGPLAALAGVGAAGLGLWRHVRDQ